MSSPPHSARSVGWRCPPSCRRSSSCRPSWWDGRGTLAWSRGRRWRTFDRRWQLLSSRIAGFLEKPGNLKIATPVEIPLKTPQDECGLNGYFRRLCSKRPNRSNLSKKRSNLAPFFWNFFTKTLFRSNCCRTHITDFLTHPPPPPPHNTEI